MSSKYYVFECQDGHEYYCKEGQCLSCANCTDVFWDYANGPYMIICKKGLFPNRKCKSWEPDKNLKREEI